MFFKNPMCHVAMDDESDVIKGAGEKIFLWRKISLAKNDAKSKMAALAHGNGALKSRKLYNTYLLYSRFML